ncbi:DUF916 and DUF3324 domain-containing protein [Candidatus Enterococcus ikei]|uniref:DUF916 and DUF3324 domain-containing protein n=1 Tax=Candidatus Enterococcus ikei TaxID=2815326 RepID=A0ABS3H0Z6_9ENTE|nr:DUF916 and DUF3324 domain-containing protein [Enterococcus sp. DIV0869a]MBO0441172.1 DUF916 and DUF3324 domain-containing protein [Enterococcus sp. DIV0869a]
MNKNKIGVILLFMFLLVVRAEQVFADIDKSEAGAVGFLYKTNHPENQQGESGYFDLRMQPGQKQTVSITLINPGEKEVKVSVVLSGVRTNSNGVLEYGPTKLEKDSSMKFDFVDVVKAPKEVVIPAKSEQALNLDIEMPDTTFDGYIAGGIQLQKINDEESEKKKDKGTKVINEYAYNIAMLLSETNQKLEPALHFVKAYASQLNGRNIVTVDIGNEKSDYLDGLTIEAQIMTDKSDEVLYESKKPGMEIGPNNVLNYQVSMSGEAMKPGNYRAHVLATAKGKKWEWTENFKITKEEAEKFNREDIGLDQNRGLDWKLVAGIVGGVLLLIITIFGLIHFTTRKKQKKRKKRPQKK